MPWTSVRLAVSTPLFNAGADGDAGVRVSSLRGAMRFWFRAVAGIGLGDNLAALSTLEAHTFGTTDHCSPVKMRIPSQPPVSPPGQPAWCRGDDGRWIVYLLGQGLGDLRRTSVIRPYIDAGREIVVQFRLGDDPDVAALVLASFWLTCAYGGLGARTRRGFGGLRIIDIQGPLPPPWQNTPQRLHSPALEFYQGIRVLWPAGPVADCMPVLARLAHSQDVPFTLTPGPQPPPKYPVFSKTHTAAGLSGGEHFNDWTYLLAHAGEQLRHFRASRPAPEARYRPRVKTPEWLDVVHGGQSDFALAALGLPVNFKDGYIVNAYSRTGEPLRRASPLWLRPVGHRGQWRLLSFAFHSQFLPPTVDVQLHQRRRRIKPVRVEHTDIVERTTRWIDNLRNDTDLRRHVR
jgi:CRISPR type III-B/RAMP module RAMP protein Cmr1